MKSARLLLFGMMVLAVANCGEQGPVGVASTPTQTPAAVATATGGLQSTSLIGGLAQSLGLLKCSPLPKDSSTATIGPWGGALTVGPHTLVVPPGALSTYVTITATLSADTVNAITFKPEGLQFQKPAYLTMSYANCNLLGRLLPKRVAYTTDAYQILEYLLSLDNLFAKQVTGQVHHFSHYAVAW